MYELNGIKYLKSIACISISVVLLLLNGSHTDANCCIAERKNILPIPTLLANAPSKDLICASLECCVDVLWLFDIMKNIPIICTRAIADAKLAGTV